MAIDYDFSGLNFDALTARILERAPAALANAMGHIHTVVTPLVPVESGNLAGSGGVTVVDLEARLLYPGPYARYQEFGVYYRHGRFGAPLRHTHGQSFFLLTGMTVGAPGALDILRRDLFAGL